MKNLIRFALALLVIASFTANAAAQTTVKIGAGLAKGSEQMQAGPVADLLVEAHGLDYDSFTLDTNGARSFIFGDARMGKFGIRGEFSQSRSTEYPDLGLDFRGQDIMSAQFRRDDYESDRREFSVEGQYWLMEHVALTATYLRANSSENYTEYVWGIRDDVESKHMMQALGIGATVRIPVKTAEVWGAGTYYPSLLKTDSSHDRQSPGVSQHFYENKKAGGYGIKGGLDIAIPVFKSLDLGLTTMASWRRLKVEDSTIHTNGWTLDPKFTDVVLMAGITVGFGGK